MWAYSWYLSSPNCQYASERSWHLNRTIAKSIYHYYVRMNPLRASFYLAVFCCWSIEKLSLPLYLRKAFFSIMQNMTDKGISLVSKSLPIKIFNSVNFLFSERNRNCYALPRGRWCVSRCRKPLSTVWDTMPLYCSWDSWTPVQCFARHRAAKPLRW